MITCPNCGATNTAGTHYCANCGAPLAATQPVPAQPYAAPPPTTTNPWMWVAIAAIVAVVLLGGVAIFLAASGGDDDGETATTGPSVTAPSSTTTAPPSSTTTATTATTAPPTTTATTRPPPLTTVPGGVGALPSGLYCRDLSAMGYSYPAAVEYWRLEGYTDRMDADLNGIPCETVYSRSDVVAYWGDYGWEDPGFDYLDTIPSGLYCRDLADAGFSYSEAVAYWYWDGLPDRMDEDLDGIPCETVYGEDVAADYWGIF